MLIKLSASQIVPEQDMERLRTILDLDQAADLSHITLPILRQYLFDDGEKLSTPGPIRYADIDFVLRHVKSTLNLNKCYTDLDGLSLLHLAVKYLQTDIAQLLLSHGADPELKSEDEMAQTPRQLLEAFNPTTFQITTFHDELCSLFRFRRLVENQATGAISTSSYHATGSTSIQWDTTLSSIFRTMSSPKFSQNESKVPEDFERLWVHVPSNIVSSVGASLHQLTNRSGPCCTGR